MKKQMLKFWNVISEPFVAVAVLLDESRRQNLDGSWDSCPTRKTAKNKKRKESVMLKLLKKLRKNKVQRDRCRAAKLFLRVLRLQEKTKRVFYHFDFGGHIDGFSFHKSREDGDRFTIEGRRLTHYFGLSIGDSLDEIEAAIAEEEKKYG